MTTWKDLLIKKLNEHTRLSPADIAAITRLPTTLRPLTSGEDVVRQGDQPHVSVVVLTGMLARYHTLRTGGRQYLSLHIAGDMPDAQALFLETMDHSLCALDQALIALVPHTLLFKLFNQRPTIGFAIWRETLIDASIFRQTITNNSARPLDARLAHFFCEHYYRARAIGLIKSGSATLPLTQTQLGELLGASLPSISRTLNSLRKTGLIQWKGGVLLIQKWAPLAELGDLDPKYLHVRKPF